MRGLAECRRAANGVEVIITQSKSLPADLPADGAVRGWAVNTAFATTFLAAPVIASSGLRGVHPDDANAELSDERIAGVPLDGNRSVHYY